MAEYKDYVFANGGIEGQVQPTVNSSPGVISSAAAVTAYTTGTGVPGFNSIIAAQQVLAVAANSSTPGGKAGAQ
jgi:hypothetical protein